MRGVIFTLKRCDISRYDESFLQCASSFSHHIIHTHRHFFSSGRIDGCLADSSVLTRPTKQEANGSCLLAAIVWWPLVDRYLSFGGSILSVSDSSSLGCVVVIVEPPFRDKQMISSVSSYGG